MSRYVNANTFLIAMLTCIGTAIVLSSAFMSWPDLPTLLLGRDKGLLEQFGGLAATTLLAVGAIFTARTFQQSQRQAEAATYEKGAELLAHDKSSANVNGMYIMNSAAYRRPERFWQPAVMAIAAYLTDCTKPRYEELRLFHTTYIRPPLEERPELPKTGETPLAALAALTALSSLRRTELEWPEWADHGGRRIEIQSFALEFCRVIGLKLDRTIISNAVMAGVFFEDCDLDDSDVHLIVYRGVSFDAKTTIRNTRFQIFDTWGFRLGDPQFTARVIFEPGCDLSTATVFGRPLADVYQPAEAFSIVFPLGTL